MKYNQPMIPILNIIHIKSAAWSHSRSDINNRTFINLTGKVVRRDWEILFVFKNDFQSDFELKQTTKSIV